jgi:hypothetical protein
MSPKQKCPSCGEAFDRPVRYCYRCGTWLQHGVGPAAVLDPPPASAGPVWPCPRCGYPSPRAVNFCANCGLRLNDAPLDRKEAKQRRLAAKRAATSPEQRDRSTVRFNLGLLVASTVVAILAIAFLIANPHINEAYIAPILALLVLRMPFTYMRVKKARARIAARKGTTAS